MYTLYKFHFLNGISEINQLFDDILIIWPAPVYIYKICKIILNNVSFNINLNQTKQTSNSYHLCVIDIDTVCYW